MNTSKLRGKRLNIIKPQTKYAKVPMQVLTHTDLTPVDKLIIAYLYSQSDSGNYILAYTRIARELNISKKWLIERWKWLKKNGFIIEDENNYFVVVGAEDRLQKKGEENTPLQDKTEVDSIHHLGEENLPIQVNKTHLNGVVTTPIEHNNQEKIKTEQGVRVENDLILVLKNSDHFKMIYDSAKWKEFDITSYSNAFIAYAVKSGLEGNPIETIKDRRLYYFLEKLVEYSSKVENSNLWKCFESECNNNQKLINKLFN